MRRGRSTGADGFALLDLDEALRLRDAGMAEPILLLEGFFEPADLALLASTGLTPVVHSIEQIEMLEKTPARGALPVFLKVNTGMNRLGFAADNVRLAWNALDAARRRRHRSR